MLAREALQELVQVLGAENVLTEQEDLLTYAYDATAAMKHHIPEVVVSPLSTEQVAEIVKIAIRHNVPIYPRGSGTNLSGGTIPIEGGIVLSMLNLNKILEVDQDNLTATVQPGVIIQALNEEASKCGLLYPPDPGTVTTATMGGSVSECSGGLRGLKYGVTKHYIMGLQLVLANGEIIRWGGKTVKNFVHAGLPMDAEAVLLCEVDGYKEVVERESVLVERILKEEGAVEVKIAKNDKERDLLWLARRSALPALAQKRPTTVLEDATVPRSKIPDMLKAIRRIATKHNLQIATFGHAGDGNLHPTILTDERDLEEMKRVHLAVDEIFETAIALGGTLSGEHGIGIAKMKYLDWEFGEAGVAALRHIKEALDPNYLFNPGKIVRRD